MAAVIHISGITGIGKTSLCHYLATKYPKDIFHIECDLIWHKTYLKLKKNPRFIRSFKSLKDDRSTPSLWCNSVDKEIKRLIKANKPHYKVILIDCVGPLFKYAKYGFCITTESLEHIYIRFLKREYEKIFQNKELIRSLLAHNPNPYTIAVDIRDAINHVSCIKSFSKYKKDYKKVINYCKKSNMMIMPPKDIIASIRHIIGK
jgi:adenylate kinase family enzyme